jgi:CRP/FNR family transcriptional regulator, polysaccharide utilization system transcription regulator
MKHSHKDCALCEYKGKSIFNHCTVDETEHMNETKNTLVFKKSQYIFMEGNRPFGLYCVSDGKIKITKTTSDGKEQIVRLVKPGDIIGYRAMMAGEKYSASAVALEDTKVCFVSEAEFNKIVTENPKVATDLFTLLSKALGEAEEKMSKMALKPVRERLAEALLLLIRTYKTPNEKEFTISISREDLASIVGTAKETVIRFLSEFKEQNIVVTKGSSITVIDEDKLIKISQMYD